MFSSTFPLPKATQQSGSSATRTGSFVVSLITLPKLRNNPPPPDKIIPLSTISEESSGGVLYSAVLIAEII